MLLVVDQKFDLLGDRVDTCEQLLQDSELASHPRHPSRTGGRRILYARPSPFNHDREH
jgi:hypothetical protein